ncbi:HD domain-containing protein [Aquimarina algiphila]|uniref:HD domain-containing protein n=1 Tax=Aquimarina algiphila TaxID=2047982 RepID=UPI002490608C|nr:hypothetical protein [Aquimarina algiphila]
MWNTTTYEEKLGEKLKEQFGKERGEELYTQYTTARNTLVADNFFSEIKAKEANLTDHSERHICDVLNNVEKLLGEQIEMFTGIELYCLALVVLFHDVGNIEGRDGHNLNIADTYNFVRKKEPRYNHERAVVIKAAQAHCGKAKDGGRDTLKDLDEVGNLEGEKIAFRDIAAILRFADELAEGNQRTSNFMIERHKYAEKSEIFHLYAQMTEVFIDRQGGRIVLTYNIDIDSAQHNAESLKKLLEFIYVRIIKLDEERRYAKYYCDILVPFKKTSIQFNFSKDGLPTNLDIGKIEIHDRFPVPGEMDPDLESFQNRFKELKIDDLLGSLFEKETIKTIEDGKTA